MHRPVVRPARITGQRPVSAGVRGIWIALLVAGVAGSTGPSAEPGTPVQQASSRPAAAAGAGTRVVPQFHSVRTYPGVALPVRLRIPAEGIDTGLERLGLASDGSITAPGRWQQAGWYDGGPRPGQNGPAVIVGHVDSRSGPAVFYRLAALRPGVEVYVDRQDGSTAHFRVTRQQQVPKDRFPADVVYSPTLDVSLLLMTCGGIFDTATGHYRDNIIVFAAPG